MKFNATQCASKLLLTYETADLFTVKRNGLEHSCTQDDFPTENITKSYLNDDIISRIRHLFRVGCRLPKKILAVLREDKAKGEIVYDTEPTMHQIKYQLKKIKKELFGESELSLGKLKELLVQKSNIPEDLDQTFVVAHKVDIPKKLTIEISDNEEDGDQECEDEGSETPKFWFLFSTRQLLLNTKDTRTLCADETYKLLWMGFSGISIGTVDMNKVFHPLAFGFSSSEKTEDWAEIFQVSFFYFYLRAFKKAFTTDSQKLLIKVYSLTFKERIKYKISELLIFLVICCWPNQ